MEIEIISGTQEVYMFWGPFESQRNIVRSVRIHNYLLLKCVAKVNWEVEKKTSPKATTGQGWLGPLGNGASDTGVRKGALDLHTKASGHEKINHHLDFFALVLLPSQVRDVRHGQIVATVNPRPPCPWLRHKS
jgi:hypothetical protein